MAIEPRWANDPVGGTKLNYIRLNAYTPTRGDYTNPNSNVTGSPGDTYLNTVGGTGTTLWVKETGVGTTTGWVATGTGSGGPALTVQDEGTSLTQRTTVNFVGTGVTATDDGTSKTTVTIPGASGGSAHTIKDEGTALTQRAGLNFVGAGVTATDNGTDTVITVPSGGGGGGIPTSLLTGAGDLPVGTVTPGVGTTVLGPVADGLVPVSDLAAQGGFNWNNPPIAYNRVQLTGSNFTARSILNFTGAGVSVADSGGSGRTDVTISGAAAIPTFTNATMNGNGYVQLKNGSYFFAVPAGSGNIVFAALDPTWNETGSGTAVYTTTGRNDNAHIHLVIQNSSTGGRYWEISPSTIAWESGASYTMGPYNGHSNFDYSANTITVIDLDYMGNGLGWYGRYKTGIPPEWTVAAATDSWTAPTGWNGVTTQQLGMPLYFGRNVGNDLQVLVKNVALKYCSQTARQRIATNRGQFEIGVRFNADGPLSATGRGSSEQFGGYSTGPGQVFTIDGVFKNFSTIAGMSNFPNMSNTMGVGVSMMGYFVHELGHAMNSQWFGGNNPMPSPSLGNGSEPALISQHSTLAAVRSDCIANAFPAVGGNPQNPSTGDEWLTEIERWWRYGDNGPLSDSPNTAVGATSIQAQVGSGNNVGGVGGTPTQRYNRVITYLTNTLVFGSN